MKIERYENMKAYQYIYIDGQQMGWNEYHLTTRHFSSIEACRGYLHPDWEAEVIFRIVGVFKPSKLTGRLAEMATKHEVRK